MFIFQKNAVVWGGKSIKSNTYGQGEGSKRAKICGRPLWMAPNNFSNVTRDQLSFIAIYFWSSILTL